LEVEGILFDALDSIDEELSDDEQQHFTWATSSQGLPTSSSGRKPRNLDLEPVCKFRPSASLFELKQRNKEIRDQNDVQSLSVLNSVF